LAGGLADCIAAERRPVIPDHVDRGNVINPILVDKGIWSLAGVPLLVHGAVIGVLHVGMVHNRVFSTDDVALLRLAADRAAVAVQSLRSLEDHAAAAALQRSLVPAALPGAGSGHRRLVRAGGFGHVGGDWYDVFRLPSGELGMVVSLTSDAEGALDRLRLTWILLRAGSGEGTRISAAFRLSAVVSAVARPAWCGLRVFRCGLVRTPEGCSADAGGAGQAACPAASRMVKPSGDRISAASRSSMWMSQSPPSRCPSQAHAGTNPASGSAGPGPVSCT